MIIHVEELDLQSVKSCVGPTWFDVSDEGDRITFESYGQEDMAEALQGNP